MPKYELFSFWKSSCSWRVRIALAWKGIEYSYRPVNLAASGGGEQCLDSYRKLNPNQRVPTLLVDGHALAQSGAILEYLEEAHPQKPLLPRDLLQRAQVRNLCGIVGCDTQPAQSMGLSAKVADLQSPASAEQRQALVVAWNRQWIARSLQSFEEELTRCAGRYCVGDDVTLADVYLMPQVFNARACSLNMAVYPTISRVVDALEKLPAFASSRPENQPDAIRAHFTAKPPQYKPSPRAECASPVPPCSWAAAAAPRSSVIGTEEFAKSQRSSFFGCQLARFLRRASTVAAEQPSHVPVAPGARGAVSATSLRRTSAPAEAAAIGAVDPEIAFKPRSFAVSTRNGARLGNEDRFRAIDNLDLYGRGLLEIAPRSVPPFFTDLLTAKVLENFVLEGRAPALRVRNLLKHGRVQEDTQFFGVYDGHGGARASSLLALLFPVYILAAPEYRTDLAAACHSASMAINQEILKRENSGQCEGGSTAVTLLIRGNRVILSNTGDCRAIMVAKRDKAAQVTQLTTDHKASNEQEKQRIEEHGGMVLYVKGVARVNGRLAVARAFGDAELSQLVIADPEVTIHEMHREDEYIVMASDGLWDVLTNEQVATCIRNNPWLNVQEMANMLTERAVELGTMDNVTVMVVDVRGRIT
ncbi:hypothetical protein PF011_g10206 [Phytophthora fragariae]|uniref:Uncharacterized protein n=1 Tax=Phytophthora fragariae TaxID=53985 RepID=A0A6A3KRQ6_9STRA|nr:hypothetical protein PF011_g10206 [Phytophthora fragariae]